MTGPLSDLSMFVSIVLLFYCQLSFIHMHSCIHSMHTDIIHTWLHCQFYFNYTKSVIRNVIQKCYQSSIFQVAGPTEATVYQYILYSPVFSQFGRYPSKGNWQYFLSYVGRYPSKGNWQYFLSYVGRYPSKGNWQYFLSYVGRYPSKGNWQYFLSYVGRYPSKGNWQYFLSYVGRYPSKGNWQFGPPQWYLSVCRLVSVCSLVVALQSFIGLYS